MRRLLIVFLLLLVFPASSSAAGTRPSCAELRGAVRQVYGQALEAQKGRAVFTACWRTRGAGRAAIVRFTGSAPQRLRVRLWFDRGDSQRDYWFTARTPTAADERAARRARSAGSTPTLRGDR